jgi:CRP-like cAMP-binding protein
MNALENSIHQFFGLEKIEDSQIVARLFKKETLAKNDFFIQKDKKCDKFSFIESGMLRQYIDLPDRQVTQWIATPGYFITDLSSFLYSAKSRWNISALTECSLYTIDHKEYVMLNEMIPRWNELEKHLICRCFITMEERIFNLISLSSEERYDYLFDQQRELFNLVPLQYLASMIGMTPETFSRIRRKKSS